MTKIKTSIEVPRKLWIRFKVACVKRDKIMSGVLEELIAEWVKANE